jgi:hypothetical protein
MDFSDRAELVHPFPHWIGAKRLPAPGSRDAFAQTKETSMRSIIFTALLAACGGTFALSASAAPSALTRGVVGDHSIVEQAQDDRYCRRLRRACEFKHERGEAGEGNCRRYRRECGRW